MTARRLPYPDGMYAPYEQGATRCAHDVGADLAST